MKYLKCFVLVCCFVHLVRFSYSARILGIFNFEMLSHFHFHEIMMRTLAKAGHHITMISPYDLPSPHENITVINLKAKKRENDDSPMKSFARVNLPFLQAMIAYLEVIEGDCRHIISLLQEKNLKNFDIMFVELMPMNQCFLPLAKEMGIPVVGTLSFRGIINLDLSVGHIRNPSVLPTEMFFINVKMSFYERLINSINEVIIRIGRFLEERKFDKFCDDLFPRKYCQNLDVDLAFVNNHASLQLTASAPHIVNVGGINVKTAKLNSLPEVNPCVAILHYQLLLYALFNRITLTIGESVSKHFKKFIDEAKDGVILFSLGSMASSDSADPHLTSILKNTFAKIPQRVIWKYSGTMQGVSNNVLLSPWIPQKEILAHKNVIAFISHCGLSSSYEAIYFGKPMILLPIFADQPGNAALLKYLGVGLHLDVLELTEGKLLEAIKEVVSNQTYHLNMEQLSRRFKDEPKSPEELVVYWTEYVLRHEGATFIRSVTVDIPLYQYLLLDVFAFVVIVLVFVVALMYVFAKWILFLRFRVLKKDLFNKKKEL